MFFVGVQLLSDENVDTGMDYKLALIHRIVLQRVYYIQYIRNFNGPKARTVL
jgi:hypothetical protein